MSTFPSKAVFHHYCIGFCSDFPGGLEGGEGCGQVQQFSQLVGKMSVKTRRSWALALCLKVVYPHDLLSLPSEEATRCQVKDGRPDLGDPTAPAACFPRVGHPPADVFQRRKAVSSKPTDLETWTHHKHVLVLVKYERPPSWLWVANITWMIKT